MTNISHNTKNIDKKKICSVQPLTADIHLLIRKHRSAVSQSAHYFLRYDIHKKTQCNIVTSDVMMPIYCFIA